MNSLQPPEKQELEPRLEKKIESVAILAQAPLLLHIAASSEASNYRDGSEARRW